MRRIPSIFECSSERMPRCTSPRASRWRSRLNSCGRYSTQPLALRCLDELRIVAYTSSRNSWPGFGPSRATILPPASVSDELEASEVQQQRAGEAGVASPGGRVAAFLIIESDQERLLGNDETHGQKLAESAFAATRRALPAGQAAEVRRAMARVAGRSGSAGRAALRRRGRLGPSSRTAETDGVLRASRQRLGVALLRKVSTRVVYACGCSPNAFVWVASGTYQSVARGPIRRLRG